MKIKCLIGFHKWEYYSMKVPIDRKSWMEITIHHRYCDSCNKNQARTSRPINMGNYWYDTDRMNKETKRKYKLYKITHNESLDTEVGSQSNFFDLLGINLVSKSVTQMIKGLKISNGGEKKPEEKPTPLSTKPSRHNIPRKASTN